MKGHSDFGAGVAVEDIPESDADRALAVLGPAADAASFLTNCLSVLTGFAAWWRPARILNCEDRADSVGAGEPIRYRRYMPLPPSEEMTSLVVDDAFMTQRYAEFVALLLSVSDPAVRRVLQTAISWQAHANSGSGLGRYLHYFSSVELLGHFFFDHLPADRVSRRPASELNQRVLEIMMDANGRNYMESAKRIAETLDVSARSKLKSLGKLVDFDASIFFQKPRDGVSLYDIRNAIAHGHKAHDDREYMRVNQQALDSFPRVAREFLTRVAIAASLGQL